MTQKLLLILLAILVTNVVRAAGIEFRDEYKLRWASGCKGSAILTVSMPKVTAGDKFDVDVKFVNEGTGLTVFNPLLNRKLPLPLVIALYDSEKKFIGAYGPSSIDSGNPATDRDWIDLPDAGASVGGRVRCYTSALPGSHLASTTPVPTGKYYLQAIYYSGFVSFARKPLPEPFVPATVAHFYDEFDRSEILRSNVVEIEVVPAAKPSP